MTSPGGDPKRTLDEYLDGLTAPAERAEMERAVGSDAAVAREARLQREIDNALRRQFAEGAVEAGPRLALAGDGVAARRNPVARRWGWISGIAAAVLLGALGIYIAGELATPRPDRLGDIYRTEVAAGFTPREVCTDPEQFAGWLKQHYGEPLYPAASPTVQLVGWSYGVALSNYSGVLLARVDQQPVVVVVDRAGEEGRKLPTPTQPGMHSYRRRIGDLVLYEVSPLPEPRILPLLSPNRG